jgi:hypothetical protein
MLFLRFYDVRLHVTEIGGRGHPTSSWIPQCLPRFDRLLGHGFAIIGDNRDNHRFDTFARSHDKLAFIEEPNCANNTTASLLPTITL